MLSISSSFQGKTHKVFLELYEEHGLKTMLSAANKALEIDHLRVKKKGVSLVVGEIGETILHCMVQDFIKRHGLSDKVITSKSLILKNPDNSDSDFLTELDYTLFSPYCIISFESKCLKGDKVVRDQGKLTVQGKEHNVYRQHLTHRKAFVSNFYKFRTDSLILGKDIHFPAFISGPGSLTDKRPSPAKTAMPFLTQETLDNFLHKALRGEELWNFPLLKKVVRLIEKADLKSVHLKYVKGLKE